MLLLSRLFFLFTITTLVELFLLLELAKIMGLASTLALVILTGFLGAWLARLEGLRVLTNLRGDLDRGKMPADAVLDGICVLIAGALLITPGVLTDLLGFALLAAPIRAPLKIYAKMRFRKWLARQDLRVVTHPPGSGPYQNAGWNTPPIQPVPIQPVQVNGEIIIDVTPED